MRCIDKFKQSKSCVGLVCGLTAFLLVAGMGIWLTKHDGVERFTNSQERGISTKQPIAQVGESSVKANSREDATTTWKSSFPRLHQADTEAISAIYDQIRKFDVFIAERKAGAKPFAADVLSLESKLTGAMAVVDELGSAVSGLVGARPATGPDRLSISIRESLIRHVLSPDQIQDVLEEIATDFVAKVKEIEGRLIIDLRADLSDDAMLKYDLPNLSNEAWEAIGGWNNSAIFNTVAEDFWVSVGVSSFSDVIAGAITKPLKIGKILNFGANVVADAGIDSGIDHALAKLGHEPEAEIIKHVHASLDRIRKLIVEGNPGALNAFFTFKFFSTRHPDPDVRDSCAKAAIAITRNMNTGVHLRLLHLYDEGSRRLRKSFARHLFGPDAPLPPELLPDLVDPNLYDPPAKIIESANAYITTLTGVTSP